jgi:DNA polymerase III sliding clamp (beta) subunit (PCNA family)
LSAIGYNLIHSAEHNRLKPIQHNNLMKVPASFLKQIARTLSTHSTKILFADNKAYAVGDTITVVLNLGTNVLSSSTFAVDAQKFKEVVNRFDGEVDVEVTENLFKLKHKRSKIELPVVKDPIIPNIAQLAGGQTLNTKDLTAMLQFVQQASEKSDQYSYAGVISLMSRSGQLTAVATDGKRVAIALGCPTTSFQPLLLPFPILGILRALAPLSASATTILSDESNIQVRFGDVLVIARQLARPFPNWESIIPQTFNLKISVKAVDMKQCLGDVKATVDPETQRLNLTIRQNLLIMETNSQGKAETSCLSTPIESDIFEEPLDYKLVVNHGFLADFFDACDGDVIIGVNSETLPLYLESNKGERRLVCLTQKP